MIRGVWIRRALIRGVLIRGVLIRGVLIRWVLIRGVLIRGVLQAQYNMSGTPYISLTLVSSACHDDIYICISCSTNEGL